MAKITITDKSGGASTTGIVIRRCGSFINVVQDESALKEFLQTNLPAGIFKREKESRKLILLPRPLEYGKQHSRDTEGNTLTMPDLAEGLGYTFERIAAEKIKSINIYA